MTALLLTLTGPLQSWGSSSRFARRGTESAPTKSGVLGLLAAAQGRRRTDSLEDLARLRFGVRIDQPGRLVRDFQTARSLDGKQSMPLSYRFYLADAVFVAAVEGDRGLLDGLADALRRPTFPLYLGRRACPPAGPLLPKLVEGTVEEALATEPWAAKSWYRRSSAVAALLEVHVERIVDCPPGTAKAVTVRDQPVSFDPERREYGWRTVRYDSVLVHSRGARAISRDAHDPMAAW